MSGLGAGEPDALAIGEKALVVAVDALDTGDGHVLWLARARRKNRNLRRRTRKEGDGPLAVWREIAAVALSQADGRGTIHGADAYGIVGTSHHALFYQ